MKILAMQAEWRKIIFVNYLIDQEVLQPLLPKGTDLDLYNGECYISLAGFLFLHTRVAGIPFPRHQFFEEFNLRFYVRRREGPQIRRGVVFISEFVKKPAFKWLANTFAHEKYSCLPMRSSVEKTPGDRLVACYDFFDGKRWNQVSASGENHTRPIASGSLSEFIAEHYFGYNKLSNSLTLEYGLEHPRWMAHPLISLEIDCSFENFYPPQFVPYLVRPYHSAQLIEGSPVALWPKRIF